jgi:integrase
MFRRTRATDLYQSGVPLELISRILGHSSIETTRIYASASLEIMREAMSGAIDTLPKEEPLWKLNEDELARLCGLR